VSPTPTYNSTDPVAAVIGSEQEDYWEIFIFIDIGLETKSLVPKNKVPEEFRKCGLPVWLSQTNNDLVITRRIKRVTSEIESQNKEMSELAEDLNK